jgi:hypothetical protein
LWLNNLWFLLEMERGLFFGLILGLKLLFSRALPNLFHLSNDKDTSIDKMGMWEGYEWIWFFSWIRPLWGWNIGLLDQLYVILSMVHLDKNIEDRLIWKDNKTRRFSVKSLCGLLSSNPYTNGGFLFVGIWKGIVPPKVEIFWWMTIINRINTPVYVG